MSGSENQSDEKASAESGTEEKRGLSERLLDLAEAAVKVAAGAKGVSVAIGKAILNSPDQLRRMEEAGRYLQDVREVAGLTRKELSDSINLADDSLLTAVENGTAVSCTLAEGLQTLQANLAILAAADTGTWQEIDEMTGTTPS